MEKIQVSRDFYATSIGRLKSCIEQRKLLEKRVQDLTSQLAKVQAQYVHMLEAQKVLSAVSDENTTKTLDFVTGMVNKVLTEVFPEEPYYIKMQQKIYAGSKPHLLMELYDSQGHLLDVSTQSGDGVKQVICFMFSICLIELRKGRRLLIMDERLNGLHKSAKSCMSSLIQLFVKGGFQFIFVEYSLNDIGKIYNVERIYNPDTKRFESRLVYVDGEYNDDIIHVADADLSILEEGEVEA